MSETPDGMENFENILKKRGSRKYRAFYSTDKMDDDTRKAYNPQDIISKITSYVNAIQNADMVTMERKYLKDIYKHKNSKLIPVSMLNVGDEVPHKKLKSLYKFETQCVSDTQLINIIEDAESVIDANRGITQEFENAFCLSQIKNNNSNCEYPMCSKFNSNDYLPISNSYEHTKDLEHLNNADGIVNDDLLHTKCDSFVIKDKVLNEKHVTYASNVGDIEINTHIFNTMDVEEDVPEIQPSPLLKIEYKKKYVLDDSLKDVDENMHRQEFNVDISIKPNKLEIDTQTYESMEVEEKFTDIHDIPSSPVLDVKFHKKCNTTIPLVYSLESFEKFEKVAMPIIDETTDFKVAKHLINSQIIGNELSIQTVFQPGFTDNIELSPILQISNEKLIFDNSRDCKHNCDSCDDANQVAATYNHNCSFKDEILFSSDEDEEYEHKEIQDLPFTCALETSYYEQSSELNKTMYVGFQTASNKSIQICTDSFTKAKNMLDDVDPNSSHGPTLMEMVDECDKISKGGNDKICRNISKHFDETKFKSSEPTSPELVQILDAVRYNRHIIQDINSTTNDKTKDQYSHKTNNERKSQSNSYNNENIKFEGFKTAGNKQIKISDKAMARCKKVFHDLDFDEDLKKTRLEELFTNKIEELDVVVHKKESPENLKITGIEDEDVIHEFQNTDIFHINKLTSISCEKYKTINHKSQSSHVASRKEEAEEKKINIVPSLKDLCTTKYNTNSFAYLNKLIKEDDDYLLKDEILTAAKTRNVYQNKLHDNNGINLNPEFADNELKLPILQGFQTASNKPLKISAAALAKTKQIFQDIHNINCDEKDLVKNPIIDNSILKRRILPTNKVNNDISSCKKKIYPNFNKDQLSEVTPLSLTPSNDEIKISNEALSNNKKDIGVFAQSKENINKFKGIQTASNKKVAISDEALAKSKAILDEMLKEIHGDNSGEEKKRKFESLNDRNKYDLKRKYDADIFEEHGDKKLRNSENIPRFQGFQTASKKKVTISDEALAKSKKIFNAIDLNQDEHGTANKNIPILQNNLETFKKMPLKGFKTTNNKTVEISEQALDRTQNIFKDIDLLQDAELIDKTDNKIGDTDKVLTFGFKTANNKNINISVEALKKSKSIFNDNINFPKVDEIVTDEIGKKVFFTTGNNKKIKISEDALNKSRQFIAGLDNNSDLNDNQDTYVKKPYKSIEKLINTQVVDNFEQTMHTEDFFKEVTPPKRPASPILSCPKAKRQKIETPYQPRKEKDKNHQVEPEKHQSNAKLSNAYKFDENYKKNKEYCLKDLDDKTADGTLIDPYIRNFNFANLLNFEFIGARNDVPNTKWTVEDIKTCFKSSVNSKIVPKNWLDNHIKLILWKLISYEIKFPNIVNVATVKNILEQLKYRYNRELYNAERSALRKILEKDDVSTRTIVLCVVAIYEDGVSVSSVANITNNVELLVTDGWYSVKATIDKMLTKFVFDNKIRIGMKIITNGAELVNCEEGIAPWENTSDVRLKLFGNSTRRARWDARLGYHGNAAILSPLSAVSCDGGKVSKLRVYITRVYPSLYVERFEDGSTVTRSERLEHIHQMKYETDRQALMEKLYEEVEKEISDQESQESDSSLSNKRSSLDSGSQIAKFLKKCADPTEMRSILTSSQAKLLEDHVSKQREKLLQNIQKRLQEKLEKNGRYCNRNVVQLLKIRVADIEEKQGRVVVTKAMLSIWKPNDAIQELTTEGAWIEVLNVVPTAIRYSEIHISAGRQSLFKKSKHQHSEGIKNHMELLHRKCWTIHNIVQNPTLNTDYNEIDTAGIIFLIEPSLKDFEATNSQFQNVYISDAEKNIICINFWGGIKKFGFENILDKGEIITCMNLQRRAGNTRRNMPQYRATELTYFTKTPKNEFARQVVEELNKKMFGIDRFKFCNECVAIKNNYFVTKCNNENISPYRLNVSEYNITKNRAFIDTPVTLKKCDENLNLTGLDFESSFRHDTELSPNTLLRKKRVNDRINKLKMYGEPPPLSPLNINNISKSASSAYKSPLANDLNSSVACNKTNLLNSETTPKRLPSCTEVHCSPVLSMNKNYVKKNPVKLNFSIDNSISIDHFAEDFDDSPPLSLD